MVQTTERLLNGGFDAVGVPKETIQKLRDLSNLRIDPGAMLAISLTDTHQLYYLQLLTLAARADQIYKVYLDANSATYDKEITPLDRMFWQRAHTEIVEQLGKGFDRMMTGSQAMIAMLGNKKNGNGAPEERKVNGGAGWDIQIPKSVARHKP